MHASLEIGLAFIEGLALILSPCILPVLPLILSTSVTGGRARPYGIILGFVLAFSVFVLLSRQIITALHIEPDVIRNVSLVLLTLLGLVMISNRLSEIFSTATQGLADLGSKLGGRAEGGFWSGIPMGALIGLVWTPCAGPVLAAVLVQVIRQQTNLQSILVTLSFAVGASIPMLIISLTGRRIMAKASFITSRTALLRKIFGGLILLAVGVMAFGANAQSLLPATTTTTTTTTTTIQPAGLTDGLAKPYPAPELASIDGWINTKPFTIASLRGKVVLVDFWTYSCINCVRTLPHLTAWDKKYRDQGLVIIGVHSPEFEFEKNLDNIKKAVDHYDIHYPVVSDSSLATWGVYNNQYWPAHYLIDKNGQVVYTHFGEGNYDVTENNIRFLLGMKDKVANDDDEYENNQITPETYLGYSRGARFMGNVTPDLSFLYTADKSLAQDAWTLDGKWIIQRDKIVTDSSESSLQFFVNAKKVFLVMGMADGHSADVKVQVPGQHDKTVHVSGYNVYTLAEFPAQQSTTITLKPDRSGVELYAFTFGG